jgi:phosphoribosylformimino-5-aminoimidazole carboxamide ribotide isomerase
VRLFQGDYARETSYSDDPVGVARRWESLGAPRLHVVDLDGARAGEPRNRTLMEAICAAAGIPVEVSGGIRTIEAVRDAFGYGARRVQLGSAAVRDLDLVRAAVAEFPAGIVVSIDSRDGEVRTDGWEGASGVRVLELARRMVEAGVPRLMFTDIGRDSTLTGPNFEALSELVAALPVPVVASGGVAKLADLLHLAEIGCEGAIVGKALYEGTVDLAEALAAVAKWRQGSTPD